MTSHPTPYINITWYLCRGALIPNPTCECLNRRGSLQESALKEGNRRDAVKSEDSGGTQELIVLGVLGVEVRGILLQLRATLAIKLLGFGLAVDPLNVIEVVQGGKYGIPVPEDVAFEPPG